MSALEREDAAATVVDFATYVEESVYDEAADSWSVVPRLVVFAAETPEQARRESGLIDSQFHPATDDELAEWEALTARPLNEKDVETLLTLVRRASRDVGKRRLKDRVKGVRGHARDALRYKSRRLAELIGKLEVYESEDENAI